MRVINIVLNVGNEQEVNKLSDGVREELARAGFTEVQYTPPPDPVRVLKVKPSDHIWQPL